MPPPIAYDPSVLETLAQLRALQQEHRDLDDVVMRLLENPPSDELLVRRLKKRKLALKDRILALEASLVPDIPA